LRPVSPNTAPGGLRLWSAVVYEGAARALVQGLKFRGAAGVADAMAARMVATAPAGTFRGALVPVPLHPRRLRRRGFNQARVLAEALARRTGLPLADCLSRRGRPTTQVGRGRAERRAAPAGAFVARGRAPERALIVDDVATTCATLAACAAALRAAGASELAAVTFARTPGR